jgi:hypothetical protein
MIIQETLTPTQLITGLFALIVTFILIAIFFGTLLYFFSFVFRIKEKTEASERLFWLRSFGIALIAVLVVYGIEFIFSILLFSPIFYAEIPIDLMNAVLATDIKGIIAALVISPIQTILLFIVMIVLIVAILSYVIIGFYKVNYGWTTLITWSAIGVFILIDITISFSFNPDGLAGIIKIFGDSIRGLAPS